MSIIARQGFKYSIIGYLGFLLGSFSTFFVFPYDLEFYGKLRFVFPMAEMLVPVVVFGISFSNVKFFTQAQRWEAPEYAVPVSAGSFGEFHSVCSALFLGISAVPELEKQ